MLALMLRLLACFAVGMVLDLFTRSAFPATYERWGLHVIIVTLSLQGSALVCIALFLREHGVTWPQAFGFNNARLRALGRGLLVGVVVIPGTMIIHFAYVNLLKLLHYPVEDQTAVELLREAHSAGKILYMGFATILLVPVAEEVFFRGILYPLLKRTGYPQLALWGAAAIFAGIHLDVAVFVPLVFLAVMLTLLYEWTNNLLACIVVHSLFNTTNFVMLFLLDNPGRTPAN